MLIQKKVAERWLTVVTFLLCTPSGASVLAKVYGVAEMSQTVPLTVLPSCLGIVAVYLSASRLKLTDLIATLQIGSISGVLGTVAYDLFRVPFHWAGYRVFVPIQVYGMWSLDAVSSSFFTDYVGLLYHASNGVTFSIALCCFFRLVSLESPWARASFAMLYAFGLETIAVATPFAHIFNLSGNVPALLIAYAGHAAYGLPIAWMTYCWKESSAWASRIPASRNWLQASSVVIGGTYLAAALFGGASSRPSPHRITVNGAGFEPEIIRAQRGESLSIHNAGDQPVEVAIQKQIQTVQVEARQSREVTINDPGIYQLRAKSNPQLKSGFVIVEPVHDVR